MIDKYTIPSRCPVVPVKGIKWSHRMIRHGMQLDPLAAKLAPLVSEKTTTVLGVLDGLTFQQWWQTIRAFGETTHGSSIRTDFPVALQNIEAAIVHIEQDSECAFGSMRAVPRHKPEFSGRKTVIPRGMHFVVSVELVGEHNNQAFSLVGEIAVRADHHILTVDDASDPEWQEDLGERFMDIVRFTHSDRQSFVKMMLLLEDTERSGILKIATGSVGSTYRLFQLDIVEHVIEAEKLYRDFQDSTDDQ